MLSVYRELKSEKVDTTELDAHVEGCAVCREVLASSVQVGEQVRSAPVLTPPPDLHAKLMRALADEQVRALRQSPPGKVATPEFLKPYLPADSQQTQDDITAFSTAETGPLPFVQARRKRRPVRVSQFGVLGLAAAALMLLMMGGLTSLLMVARNNPNSITKTINSVNRPIEVNQKLYTTTTSYAHVASALPSGNRVYYSASDTGTDGASYMLMQFDRTTQVSTPLLTASSTEPVVVLAASHDWLVWLEFSRSQALPHTGILGSGINKDHSASQRTWSLHYLSLLPRPQSSVSTQAQAPMPGLTMTATDQPVQTDVPASLLLEKGTFDSYTAPGWITTPIQGTWLMGDMLLVAQIDQQGVSHLERYLLGSTAKMAQAQEIANAPAGHVLAWPTADSTGLILYWADEWVSPDGLLQSNIWQQKTDEQLLRSQGHLKHVATQHQQLYLGDGMSFQPQMVDGTLFWLSTSEIKVSDNGVVTPNGTPFPLTATNTSVRLTPRNAADVYPLPADASLHGTIFMVPLNGLDQERENTLGTVGQSTGLQTGSSYVIWQDTSGYQMYDLQRQANVALGNTLSAASLLVVNGDTTFWLADEKSTPHANLTFLTFNWPN